MSLYDSVQQCEQRFAFVGFQHWKTLWFLTAVVLDANRTHPAFDRCLLQAKPQNLFRHFGQLTQAIDDLYDRGCPVPLKLADVHKEQRRRSASGK
jgi:hypothetical protein